MNFFKISLLTLLYSISLQAHEPLNFPEKFKLRDKSFEKHQGPSNFIEGIDENRNYTDLDGDGIIDLMDQDIDGDGAINYLDYAPLDKKIKGADRDKDGIPDFLDFKVSEKLFENMSEQSARLQELLWEKKKVLLFNGDAPFSDLEYQRIAELYLKKELKDFPELEHLKVIFKQPTHSMGYRAKYRSSQRAITLYFNRDHHLSPLHQELSLVHESFHALAYENEEAYEYFKSVSGWVENDEQYIYKGLPFAISDTKTNPEKIIGMLTSSSFPSDYSKFGPEEMFAECATASLMMPREKEIIVKYPRIREYKASETHQLLLSIFPSLFK